MRILPASDHATVSFATSELASYLTRMGLPATVDAGGHPAPSDAVLHLCGSGGPPTALAALAPGLRHDGFIVGAVDGVLHLAAAQPRGLLHAVYAFLEDCCGAVFAGPGCEHLPRLAALPLPPPALSNPALAHRHIGFHELHDDTLLPGLIDWMAKRRFNGIQVFAPRFLAHRALLRDEAVGKRGMGLDVGAHSAFFFLPPERFLADHPDWYAPPLPGKTGPAQLCYGSTGMAAALGEQVVTFLDRHPEVSVVGLWPEDGIVSCSCPSCQGRALAPLIYRRVAEAATLIARRHPRVLVNHLSYLNSTRPPDGAAPLPANVLVNHCDYWDRTINRPLQDLRFGTKPLKDAAESAVYAASGGCFRDHREICAELRGWRRLCAHPTVFSYYSDLIIKQRLPTDVASAIRLDCGLLRDLGYDGFTDCCCHPEEWQAMAWNLFALSAFAWDPEADEDSVRRRFWRGTAGPAAVEAGLAFHRRLGELENEPSVMGFNTLDLLHRNPRETLFYAGLVGELVAPCRDRYERQLARLAASVDELAKYGAPTATSTALRTLVTRLGERLRSQFASYIGASVAKAD